MHSAVFGACLLAACLALAGEPLVRNGAMTGAPLDHSKGQGQLVAPAGWTPVNIDTNRGDRLSVEPSERAGAEQCLRIKTFGNDAGVYQSLAPLATGKTYLVSAWVKRLSGVLAVEAYPYAWGPAVMRRVDDHSTGWTRLTVGLTPIDAGAHLYLVASPQAEFLIDDVRMSVAPIHLGTPQLEPYDLTEQWRYRVTLGRGPASHGAAAVPGEVAIRALVEGRPLAEPGATCRVALPPTGSTSAELRLPLRQEGGLEVEVTDPATGAPLGATPICRLVGDPWDVLYPYKDALFASLGHRWPLRVRLRPAAPDVLRRLRADVTIGDQAGTIVRRAISEWVGDALVVPIEGPGLAAGEYRLALVVQDESGRTVHQAQRSLRCLAPAASEVVLAADGRILVSGKPWFAIGLYWVFADPVGWRPGPGRKEAELQELRRAGFNTLHTYAFEHNDANDTDENALAYLDTARDFGFMVMMGLRREWYQGQALDETAIEQRVRRLRDHPALLCWTLWDEPNFDPATAPRVQAMYDLVDRTDPYHPAMPVFGGPAGGPFRACADANLFDCYPGPGGASTVERALREATVQMPGKPVWFVAQAHRSGPDAPLPEEEDMRRFWQCALAGGAQAVFWYSYGGDGRLWDSIRTEPAHFEKVKRIIGELARKVGQE